MSKRIVNRTLSAAVFAALYAGAGYAQQPPADEKTATELETVVVTGSLIKGTQEDTALPVEVFTSEQLKQQGDPSALEFVKSLTISGPTTGEAYYFGGSNLTNNVQFNLRGIGADKTLTLFNGRRAFQNAAVYPSSVLERIDVLKDGAAVTYGADATGGVVNIITKTKFQGVEVGGSYKTYKGSEDGEWKLTGMAGFSTDFADVIFAVEWDHKSELGTQERSFSSLPYATNPAPSSQLTNLAAWLPRGALPATPTINPASTNGAGEWGNPVAGLQYDFNQSKCEAVGGTFVPLTAASAFNKCTYNYIPYYNIVEQNEVYRVFAQVTSKIGENTDLHLRALWARNYSPHQYGSPSQPVVRGPALTTGATYQIYVPSTNPYVGDFLANSGYSGAGASGYTPVTYRAFAHGGNDTFAKGDNHSVPNKNDTKYIHLTGGFTGDVNDYFAYDVAATYNAFASLNSQPDIHGYRLQQALNGFGGPNCNVPDLDPVRNGTQNAALAGSPGCLWYNPFASNFVRQPTWNYANPSYVSGHENPRDLVEWLYNKREAETTQSSFTFDAVFSGATPLSLPGGDIAWAAGVQYRDTQNRENVPDPLYNGQTPCDWPGQNPSSTINPDGSLNTNFTGCTLDRAGPYLFFANNPPDSTEQQQQSVFAELRFPILDSLELSAAGRYEKFEPIGLDASVYKFSTKWQIIDQFALRGSYGTNYQAPGANVIPGDLNNGVNSYTRANGAWLGAQTYTRTDIVAETAKVWSLGAISQFDIASSDVQIILDYFHIQTENELGLLASANDIADSVFAATGTRLANCSHPLISRVTFNSACVQGTTNASNFSSIRTDFGNGPGQLTDGFDLQLRYGLPIGPGRLTLSATVTKIEDQELGPVILDGYQLKPTDNRLGYLNFATVAFAVPEWRGNFDVNYNFGQHNIRGTLNWVSGVKDERYIKDDGTIDINLITPEGRVTGSATDNLGPSYYGVVGDKWMSVDLHYQWRSDIVDVGFSILNVTDEDPPESRQEFGYDPRIGNPYGRQAELRISKQFKF